MTIFGQILFLSKVYPVSLLFLTLTSFSTVQARLSYKHESGKILNCFTNTPSSEAECQGLHSFETCTSLGVILFCAISVSFL